MATLKIFKPIELGDSYALSEHPNRRNFVQFMSSGTKRVRCDAPVGTLWEWVRFSAKVLGKHTGWTETVQGTKDQFVPLFILQRSKDDGFAVERLKADIEAIGRARGFAPLEREQRQFLANRSTIQIGDLRLAWHEEQKNGEGSEYEKWRLSALNNRPLILPWEIVVELAAYVMRDIRVEERWDNIGIYVPWLPTRLPKYWTGLELVPTVPNDCWMKPAGRPQSADTKPVQQAVTLVAAPQLATASPPPTATPVITNIALPEAKVIKTVESTAVAAAVTVPGAQATSVAGSTLFHLQELTTLLTQIAEFPELMRMFLPTLQSLISPLAKQLVDAGVAPVKPITFDIAQARKTIEALALAEHSRITQELTGLATQAQQERSRMQVEQQALQQQQQALQERKAELEQLQGTFDAMHEELANRQRQLDLRTETERQANEEMQQLLSALEADLQNRENTLRDQQAQLELDRETLKNERTQWTRELLQKIAEKRREGLPN